MNFHNFLKFKTASTELETFSFEDFAPMFMTVHSTLSIPSCLVVETAVKNAQLRWEEEKIGIEGEDVALENEVKDTLKIVLGTLEEREEDIRGSTKENLWEVYVDLLGKVRKVQ